MLTTGRGIADLWSRRLNELSIAEIMLAGRGHEINEGCPSTLPAAITPI